MDRYTRRDGRETVNLRMSDAQRKMLKEAIDRGRPLKVSGRGIGQKWNSREIIEPSPRQRIRVYPCDRFGGQPMSGREGSLKYAC